MVSRDRRQIAPLSADWAQVRDQTDILEALLRTEAGSADAGSTGRLALLRRLAGMNQTEVAERLGVSQSRVSRLERADVENCEMATIRAYVTALGGQVEVVARVGDRRIMLG